mmetsp:Transcript_20510/g.64604  ORF Transcript_20510/g.64604 Transcript_20510/m.64604 type:complete len:238 (-) Transcript_20510:12-725(-)
MALQPVSRKVAAWRLRSRCSSQSLSGCAPSALALAGAFAGGATRTPRAFGTCSSSLTGRAGGALASAAASGAGGRGAPDLELAPRPWLAGGSCAGACLWPPGRSITKRWPRASAEAGAGCSGGASAASSSAASSTGSGMSGQNSSPPKASLSPASTAGAKPAMAVASASASGSALQLAPGAMPSMAARILSEAVVGAEAASLRPISVIRREEIILSCPARRCCQRAHRPLVDGMAGF